MALACCAATSLELHGDPVEMVLLCWWSISHLFGDLHGSQPQAGSAWVMELCEQQGLPHLAMTIISGFLEVNRCVCFASGVLESQMLWTISNIRPIISSGWKSW